MRVSSLVSLKVVHSTIRVRLPWRRSGVSCLLCVHSWASLAAIGWRHGCIVGRSLALTWTSNPLVLYVEQPHHRVDYAKERATQRRSVFSSMPF